MCIESLNKTIPDRVNLYLIDSASTDGSGERLKKLFPDVRYYRLDRNSGYAAGNNFGLRKAHEDGCRYFLIMNNDVTVKNDVLTPMLEVFRKDSSVGIVTCKVLYKDNPEIINAAGGGFSRFWCKGSNLRIGERDSNVVENKYVDFVPGVLVFIKREVLDIVGYMKEHYFMYLEDLEYSLRVKKHFKLYYTSEAVIYHKSGGGIRGKSYSETYLYYSTRNRLWLYKECFFWRFDIILYSFINCTAKSLIICTGRLREKSTMGSSLQKMKKLWLGFLHGLFTSPSKT
jgi:GT2 family glycosyltransferase